MTSQQIKDLLSQHVDEKTLKHIWERVGSTLEQLDSEYDAALATARNKGLQRAMQMANEEMRELSSLERVTAIEHEAIALSIDIEKTVDS